MATARFFAIQYTHLRGDFTMDETFIRERISQLAAETGKSEKQISRELTSGKSMPSITMLFQLCEYFEVSPRDFFDPGIKYPLTLQNILTCASHLNDDDLETLEMISRKLSMSPEDPEGSE